MSESSRIEQFKKMAHDDPGNELGHLSLGREYHAQGQWEPAIASLRRALEINPNLGRAYQLLGEAELRAGRKVDAIQTWTRGVTVAHERGEFAPRDEMVRQLEAEGATSPKLGENKPAEVVGEGEVLCRRCGKPGNKMPSPPFSREPGPTIQQNICAACWREWLGMSIKVINELRLPMSDPQAQAVYDRHMFEFLNLK